MEKSVQIHVSRNENQGGNGNSTVQSLLPNDSKLDKPSDGGLTGANLKDSLFGNFKGFSISPISNGTTNPPSKPAPARPAPSTPVKAAFLCRPGQPAHAVPVAAIKPMRMAPKAPPPPVEDAKSPPTLPPPNNTTRPLISSPVLANTTSSTVKELIKKDLPVRPAPPVPPTKSSRPSSTPGTLEVNMNDLESAPVKAYAKEQSLTLNRIASFISKPQHSKTEDKRDGVSLKAAKIDRDTLKNLKISDPIPLNEPSMAVNPLPLSKEQEKSVVMRAQSLRQNKKERGPIHTFGSVRLTASRRPTSIPVCSRPTSPPPCPPPTAAAAQTKSYYNNYQNHDQDSDDNIYAVIEENPSDESINSPEKNPMDGLLNEIVSEIQARNINSIYSSDSKKKSEDEDTSSAMSNFSSVSSPDKNLYENTSSITESEYPKSSSSSSSTTSSGYLMPIRSNPGSKATTEGVRTKIKVPEKSAPGYKPFSVPRKPVTIVPSLHAKTKLSAENAKSSQEKSDVAKSTRKAPDTKSAVSSVVNKFNASDEIKTKPAITKPKPGVVKPAAKSETKPAKAPSVASIQQKFETQAKPVPKSFNVKTDKNSFKK